MLKKNGSPGTENQGVWGAGSQDIGVYQREGRINWLKSQEDRDKTLDLARLKVFVDVISTVSVKYVGWMSH